MNIEYLGTYNDARAYKLLQRKTKFSHHDAPNSAMRMRDVWTDAIERAVLDGVNKFNDDICRMLEGLEVAWYTQLPKDQEFFYYMDDRYRPAPAAECVTEIVGITSTGSLIKMTEIPSSLAWFPRHMSVENLYVNITEFRDLITEFRDLVAFHSL